jgi:hypothetical protein
MRGVSAVSKDGPHGGSAVRRHPEHATMNRTLERCRRAFSIANAQAFLGKQAASSGAPARFAATQVSTGAVLDDSAGARP